MSRAYKQPDQNRASSQRKAGHTGIHKDMSGNVIGGYDQTGAAYGTKTSRQGYRSVPAQATQQAAPQPASNGTAPATGQALVQRQALFKDMEKAGFNDKTGETAITPEMRERARSLGVGDEAFNQAAQKIKNNSAYSPVAAKQPVVKPSQPAYKTPPASPYVSQPMRKSDAPRAPITEDGDHGKINTLTGLPMGAMPGDAAYVAKNGKPEPTQEEKVKEQNRQANNEKLLDEIYAKKGIARPGAVQPVTAKPANELQPAAKAASLQQANQIALKTPQNPANASIPAQTMAKPSAPTMQVDGPTSNPIAMNQDSGDYGTSWKTPPKIGLADAAKSDLQSTVGAVQGGIRNTGGALKQTGQEVKQIAKNATNDAATAAVKMGEIAQAGVDKSIKASDKVAKGIANITPGQIGVYARQKTRGW